MDELIRGHDVGLLCDALRFVATSRNEEAFLEHLISPNVTIPLALFSVYVDLRDPAKVAELIAVLLKQCGLRVAGYPDCERVCIQGESIKEGWLFFDMPAARALLLAILESDRKPETVLRLVDK